MPILLVDATTPLLTATASGVPVLTVDPLAGGETQRLLEDNTPRVLEDSTPRILES